MHSPADPKVSSISKASRSTQLIHPHLLLLEDMKRSGNYFQSQPAPAEEMIHSLPPSDVPEDDFLACLRPFLLLGNLFGLLPLGGLWKTSSTSNNPITFSWRSLRTLAAIPILIFLLTNVVLSCVGLFRIFADKGGGNASRLAFAARDPVFYSMGTFVYAFFLLKARSLLRLFSKWRTVTADLGFKAKDSSLSTHVNVATATIFSFGVLENVVFTLTHFPIMPRNPAQEASESGFSPLETYYFRSHPFWASLIPFSVPLTLAILGVNALSAFAWNYADIFIVLSSRALYFKFKILVNQTESQLLSKSTSTLFDKVDVPVSWRGVRSDHLTLCKLLEEFEVFLSPLIFTSYTVNIFFICLELHQGLTPQEDQTALDSAFSALSFLHLVFRVMAVSLTAAKVNEYAHLILLSVQRCSTQQYCKELERLERMLASGPIGLSGLGCFVITRAFLLMVVSVIFTVEIVLLQASATPHNPPTPHSSPLTPN